MSASVSKQFGIDLSRSWALGYVKRASFPSLIGLAVAAWLMTGVTALDINDRAVYEAFGNPQAVFHSGLHVHLPWPFGRLKPVEYGVVREIPIVFPAEAAAGDATVATSNSDEEDEQSAPAGPKPTPATIEGRPPIVRTGFGCLPSVRSQLPGGQQPQWPRAVRSRQHRYPDPLPGRLSDQAAMDAVYSVDGPEDLIRAAAGRMLARYFAATPFRMSWAKTASNSFAGSRANCKAG